MSLDLPTNIQWFHIYIAEMQTVKWGLKTHTHLDVSVVCREGSPLKCHPATRAGLGGKGIKRAAERLAAVMSRLLMSSNLATGCDELEVNGVEEGRCLSPK